METKEISELFDDCGIDEIEDRGRSIPAALAALGPADCYAVESGVVVHERGTRCAELARFFVDDCQ